MSLLLLMFIGNSVGHVSTRTISPNHFHSGIFNELPTKYCLEQLRFWGNHEVKGSLLLER